MFLKYLQQNIEKKRAGIKEGIDLGSFINKRQFVPQYEPFPHVIIDDFFTKTAYKELSSYFTECLGRGISESRDSHRFHPFLDHKGIYEYDGYLHSFRLGENKILDVFFSVEWNLLFSKIFKQETDWCTSTAFHYHPPKNRTGYIHNDYAPKKFIQGSRLSNGVIAGEVKATEKNSGSTFTSVRIISLIYYLNNDGWKDGDGGGTGLYTACSKSSMAKLVEPLNNRLLAFQISPRSFHAFQQNFKPRSSIVQWFHVDPEWCQKKYGFLE